MASHMAIVVKPGWKFSQEDFNVLISQGGITALAFWTGGITQYFENQGVMVVYSMNSELDAFAQEALTSPNDSMPMAHFMGSALNSLASMLNTQGMAVVFFGFTTEMDQQMLRIAKEVAVTQEGKLGFSEFMTFAAGVLTPF